MRSFILSQCRDLAVDGCDMRRFRSFNHSTCKTVLNLVERQRGEWRRIRVEQDSKAKALTAAQKLKNYIKAMQQTQIKITITSLPYFTYSSPIDR